VNTTNGTDAAPHCPYCGNGPHQGVCHMVKAIEYYPNGQIKRVEMKGAQDYHQVTRIDPPSQRPIPYWNDPVIAQATW
jgi:hypothetical protein